MTVRRLLRGLRLLVPLAVAGGLVLALHGRGSSARSVGAAHRRTAADTAASGSAPVGIVNAFGPEQAAILRSMQVTGHRRIDGYLFYTGTLAGRRVVDVAGGEADESAELATYLLDTHFAPRATLFEGTAGAQNNRVHVGDVVLSGFVVDKSAVHYELGDEDQPYSGEQLETTGRSDLRGALLSGHGQVNPTPRSATGYGEGPRATSSHLPDVVAYAAPRALVRLGERASDSLGTTSLADATGNAKASGTIRNRVLAGVVGQADVWTEPLSVIAAQNMLYQTDAEENEGSGFAFANAQLGVPWLLVRGISDSVWYPNAYDGVIASVHAARVVRAIVAALPAHVSRVPETVPDLSPDANARRAGYLVAAGTYETVSPVRRVLVTRGSHTVALSGPRRRALEREYTYRAGRIRPAARSAR